MADPASGLFQIAELPNKRAHTTAILLDRTWFFRYSRPMQIIGDDGSEFLCEEFQEMIQSFGIEPTPTTVKNPQANFVERIHVTLGNMLRTMMLEEVSNAVSSKNELRIVGEIVRLFSRIFYKKI